MSQYSLNYPRHTLAKFTAGAVRERTFVVDEVPDAQRRMEAGEVTGKIAVRIWQPS